MQADPYAQQRIGEAVPLLPRRDEVDVLQPRQAVLPRPRRALQALGNLRERESFFFPEDLQNRLERAVAAGAVQSQLVGEAALLRETAVGGEQRGQRADGGAA